MENKMKNDLQNKVEKTADVVFVCAALLVFGVADFAVNANKAYPGVRVGQIDAAGKTADELADKTRHAGHVAGEKVQHVENRMQEKGQQWKNRADEGIHQIKDRMQEQGHRIGNKVDEAYDRTRHGIDDKLGRK